MPQPTQHHSPCRSGGRRRRLVPFNSADLSKITPAAFFGNSLQDFTNVTYPPVLAMNYLRSWDTYALSADTSTVIGMHWDEMNPSSGVFRWSVADQYATFLDAHGKEAIVAFAYNQNGPYWFEPTGFKTPGSAARTTYVANYVAWVTAFMQRYKGRRFTRFEIMNEPNNAGATQNLPAELVAQLYAAAGPIIQSYGGILLSPPLNSNGSGYLSSFLSAGGTGFTEMSFHFYDKSDPTLTAAQGGHQAIAAAYDTVLATWGLTNLPRNVSELSYATAYGVGQTAATERDYIGWMFPEMRGWSDKVQHITWYAYDNANTGKLYTTGTTLNVAGSAMVEMEGWLIGAVVDPVEFFNSNLSVSRIHRASGYYAEIVSTRSGTVTYSFPTGRFLRYRDLAGNITAIGAATSSVSVGTSALILESGTG